ncbi:MAG: amino acid adenylation domain-containing protein, partial [Planctomycetota bacterium]|nr:amino acid adenylation domain-containing protein [Planctomycetota bacterium]
GFHVHELSFNLSESDGRMEFVFWFNSDLYDDATAERWMQYYEVLLAAIVENANQRISELPLLPDAERRTLLEDWNRTDTEFSRNACIHELFEACVERVPNATALVSGTERLTYGELNNRANQLAQQLLKKGVRAGSLVGVCLDRSADMVVGVLAVLKAGAAYVPLDPAFPGQRLAFMIQDCQASHLVTERRLANLFEHTAKVIHVDTDCYGSGPCANPDVVVSADELAYVIYTSGSTGQPKGVQIPHRAVVNFLESMRRKPGLDTDDVLLSVTTLSFDIAALEIFLPLVTGARLEIAGPEDIADGTRLIHKLSHSGATIMQATPATWRLLLESGWAGSPKLKILCGGETLPRELADQLLARGREVWNLYGPTETTIWSTVARVDPHSNGPISIGRPIANTDVYILDHKLIPVPVGVTGRLYIGGTGLARGYLNRAELTAERFVPHPFRKREGCLVYDTGDLARYLADGRIEFLGRIDHQVKLRGFRIELGEIEQALSWHPLVQQAVVVARETDFAGEPAASRGEESLVAYVIANRPLPSTSDLRDFLAEQLPDYMLPAAFVFLDEFPMTPNRKVDRKRLPAPKMDRPQLRSEYQSPQDSLELQLCNIWSRVLNVRPVGRNDNFFDLGGHSLLAVRMIVEIEKQYGERLPLAALLQAPTIEQFAALIRKRNWKPAWASLVPIQPGGQRLPLFLMHSHGGNVLEYYPLARYLGKNQPVYALQARGLNGNIDPEPCLEEMARNYLEEIKSLQPDGPYQLGGFCFGGTVALEAARQLQAGGDEVSRVVLIQCQTKDYPSFRPAATFLHRAVYRMSKRIDLELSNLAPLNSKARLVYIWERIRRSVEIVLARTAIALEPLLEKIGINKSKHSMTYVLENLSIAHHKALEKYRERPYKGRVILLRAEKQLAGIQPDKTLGWSHLLNGELEVHEVPGHQQNMLNEPNVASLARCLRACLDQNTATNGRSRSGQNTPRTQRLEMANR